MKQLKGQVKESRREKRERRQENLEAKKNFWKITVPVLCGLLALVVLVELLKDIGYDLGIEFNFRCPVWPNTIMAHILVEYAKTVNDGALHGQVVDRLFQLYFTKGRALEKRHIIAVAEDFGFDVNVVEKLIDDPDRAEEIKQKAAVWRTMGIEAIPFIFMNGHSMFSGDQDEAALINTITKVAQKFPLGHGDTCL